MQFRPATLVNRFPRFELVQKQLCLKKDNKETLEFAQFLNVPADNVSDRGENETGANISPYTVYTQLVLPLLGTDFEIDGLGVDQQVCWGC